MSNTWRSEYIDIKGKTLNRKQIELLEKGPHSLSSSWALQAMHNDWKKIKGLDKEDPKENTGQFQSTFKKSFRKWR
jgi:hypothetical protein|tara:strand:+ start:1758 stop:1985 length:228 start_codon:yes stop_codon:yes gene_type:complete